MLLRHKGKVSAGKIYCRQRLRGGKADLPLRHKDKLVLVRFIAETKIGRRQSRFAPPSQRKVSAGKIYCRHKD